MDKKHLLVPVRTGLPFIYFGRAITRIEGARITPTINEITGITGGQIDTLFGVTGNECRTMANYL
jgi:hypothetical protein